MTPFEDQWNAHLARIKTTLEAWLSPRRDLPEALGAVLRYAALGGGKRIRPVLACAASQAAGGAPEWGLPSGCALELIHAYSLVHDDLPSMDDDDLRRGKPTVHKAYGEAVAILAGDALQSEAFFQLAQARNWHHSISGEVRLRVISEVARAAGSSGMVGGQHIDIAARDRALDRLALEQLHRLKTGALIHAAAVTGGMVAGAGAAELAALSRYGDAVGLLFQLTDDLLDYREEQAAGKTLSEEEAAVNFIALLGADAVATEIERLKETCLEAAAVFAPRDGFLKAYAQRIARRET